MMMQQMIIQMFGNNPLFQRARQMAEGKSQQEINQIAENLCKQKGLNVGEMRNKFQSQIGNMFGSF